MSNQELLKEKEIGGLISETKLKEQLYLIDSAISKSYLTNISLDSIVKLPSDFQLDKHLLNIRVFKLTKIVFDKDEDILDKLTTIYNTLGNVQSTYFLLLKNIVSNNHNTYVELYLCIKQDSNPDDLNICSSSLQKSFAGNFPGFEISQSPLLKSDTKILFENVFDQKNKIITSATGIPSLKDENKESFVQGLEKLLEGMKTENYSAILLAQPVNKLTLQNEKKILENIYSELSPFAETQLNFGINENINISEAISSGISNAVNSSKTLNQSETKGTSTSETNTTSSTKGFNLSRGLNLFGISRSIGFNYSKTKSEAIGTTDSESKTYGESSTFGTTKTVNENLTNTKGSGQGSSQNIQITQQNKEIKNILDQIDEQLERIKQAENFGLWSFAGYFISENFNTSKIAANKFISIIKGDKSVNQSIAINTWNAYKNPSEFITLVNYLQSANHPQFKLNPNDDNSTASPTTLINSKELSIAIGMPQKSVPGLPVIEMAEFGRNITKFEENENERNIKLGKIFHLGRAENSDLKLSVDKLTQHTFITGSTGSGKSNTIYKIIDELTRQSIKFLIIEPAKGEYKDIFGGRKDLKTNVFSTNPKFAPLLKINPFKFPEEIHVLEHIDRLIEIFNATWSMYAAMPAILKEAVENIYISKGWDLNYSICPNGKTVYPTFDDLLKVLPVIINMSGYAQELKSNYEGALVTRVKSLTNGLIGRIFCENELAENTLFDENCIIDLSRVGSIETKSLIMGILFLRLSEYRMCSKTTKNSNLKHITVLEEAHHLLRRTSSEQSQEGANLQGKAVEMLANSIAEMRTYGEGFIIADQAPGLLDLAVIRNTNTKIILGLPDQSDRELVGKAAGLKDEQIDELAKLKTGVAVVFQSDWIEPVLALFDRFDKEIKFEYSHDVYKNFNLEKMYKSDIVRLLLHGRIKSEEKLDLKHFKIEEIQNWINSFNFSQEIKTVLNKNIEQYKEENKMSAWEQENFPKLANILYKTLNINLFENANTALNFEEFNDILRANVRNYIDLNNSNEYELSLIQALLSNIAHENKMFEDTYFKWTEQIIKNNVI